MEPNLEFQYAAVEDLIKSFEKYMKAQQALDELIMKTTKEDELRYQQMLQANYGKTIIL